MVADGVDHVVVAEDVGGVECGEDRDRDGTGREGDGEARELTGEGGGEVDFGMAAEGVEVSGRFGAEGEDAEGRKRGGEDGGDVGEEVGRAEGVAAARGVGAVTVETTRGVDEVDGGEGLEVDACAVDGLDEASGGADEGKAGAVFLQAGIASDQEDGWCRGRRRERAGVVRAGDADGGRHGMQRTESAVRAGGGKEGKRHRSSEGRGLRAGGGWHRRSSLQT